MRFKLNRLVHTNSTSWYVDTENNTALAKDMARAVLPKVKRDMPSMYETYSSFFLDLIHSKHQYVYGCDDLYTIKHLPNSYTIRLDFYFELDMIAIRHSRDYDNCIIIYNNEALVLKNWCSTDFYDSLRLFYIHYKRPTLSPKLMPGDYITYNKKKVSRVLDFIGKYNGGLKTPQELFNKYLRMDKYWR